MVLRERHSRQPGWTRRRFSTPLRLDTAWYSTYPVAISMVLWLLLPLVGHQAVADAKREFARPSAISMVVPADRYHRSGIYPTWLQNAVTMSWPHGWPAVAVVIDDLGLNSDSTRALNELPAPLTLAFLPYANALERQTRLARAAGHELLVHVPMEPIGHEWPGPKALTKALSQHELLTRLRAQLQRFQNFVGINNHMGSLLTSDRQRMAWVMRELSVRRLLFVDSLTTPRTAATEQARRHGVPYAKRDVFLDNELDLDRIFGRLAEVERIAKRRGYAIAIGHPHWSTIAALRRWLPTLQARGLVLVPVSAIVARRSCAEGLLSVDACGPDLRGRILVASEFGPDRGTPEADP